MAFVARTYEQILEDMIAHVKSYTTVHDFTVGSVVRTTLEAAALEDDEQYFQMTQLLDAFSILSAHGDMLDERLADYGLTRRPAQFAVGRVRFFDTMLVTNQVSSDVTVGSTSITLFSTASFPTTYPYTIRVGEGSSNAQDLEVTNNDTATGVLTLSTATIRGISAGYRCSLVSGGVRNISIGTTVQVPASTISAAKSFVVEEATTLLPGNYYSGSVRARCVTAGEAGNVSPERVSQFQGAAPFTNAGVLGVGAFAGGKNREKDEEFRRRGLQHLQSLSRGTPLALRAGVTGLEDTATGQKIVSASVVEDFVRNEVRVYVDNGGGLVPDTVSYGTAVLSTATTGIETTITLSNADSFPSSGWLLIEDDGTDPAELVEYTSRFGTSFTLTSATGVHAASTRVNAVDVLTQSAIAGKRFFRTVHYPIVRDSDRIFISDGSTFRQLVLGTDYQLVLGNGEIQLDSSITLTGGETLLANYSYYTNIISLAQQVIEGSATSPELFPGIRAGGVRVVVEAPLIRRVAVRLALVAHDGYAEEDLIPLVRSNIESYILSLGVGQTVIRSKLIDVAFNVVGVKDIILAEPYNNLVILENEKAIPFSSSGASLVQVS